MTPETLEAITSFVEVNLATLGVRIAGSAAILVAGWWAAGRLGRFVDCSIDKAQHVDQTLKPLVVSMVRNAARVVAVVAALANAGVETSSLLAVFGAAGLAVGLALQGTLSNVAAGVMLLLLRPFQVGHDILVQGHTGTVQRIGLFTTELVTADHLFVSLPNGVVWGAPIVNYTRHPTRRIEFTVAIDYGDDLDRAIAVGTAALARDPHVHAAPAPLVAVSCLAPTSVELVLRAYVAQGDYLAARYALQRAVKTDLQAAGIHLPPSPRPPRA